MESESTKPEEELEESGRREEVFTVSHQYRSELIRTSRNQSDSDQKFLNHFTSQIAGKVQIFLIRI